MGSHNELRMWIYFTPGHGSSKENIMDSEKSLSLKKSWTLKESWTLKIT